MIWTNNYSTPSLLLVQSTVRFQFSSVTQSYPTLCDSMDVRTPVRFRAPLIAQLVKNPPAMWETWVRSLGWEDPLEKGKATHSSILAWRIPWTVQSMGLQRVRHN